MGAEGGAVADGTELKGTDAGVCVNVRCSNGLKFSVKATLHSDVRSFKCLLAQNSDTPADQQRLIYKGRILKDHETLESYGLGAEHTVHLVRSFAQSASPSTVPVANTGIPSFPSNTRQGGLEESGAFGGPDYDPEASLFPGLIGSFGERFEYMRRQIRQNPYLMRDIVNIPVVRNLMDSPEIIQSLIMNNPYMHEVMDRNPELARAVNDPAIIRQIMEAARNLEYLREMVRNNDRAMSNIESSPGGFNMLRRMYENVQEPFLNSTTMAGDTRNDISSNPFASLLATTGGGQGHIRDQATDPTSAGSENAASVPAPNADPLPNPWASGAAGVAQANSTGMSNTDGDTRQPSVSGLSGLGLPPLDQMFGSTNNTSSLSQFMQNPAVSELMQSLLSNPQHMNQMLGLNPQLQNVLDSNTQLREMMQNPDFIRQLTSPEMMQQLLNFQQALPLLGAPSTTGDASQTGGGAGMDMLMNMFSGLGTGGLSTIPPNRTNVAPEELYATQLSQLQELGFFDVQENLRALIATSGNVQAAVERLLGNMGQ